MLSVNVTVHHGDPYNDGANLAETVLAPSNVNSTDFGKLFSTTLDGAIYAQPLYLQNVNVTRGSSPGDHCVLYVATLHDSLFAIDANTGAVLWQDSFLNISDPTNLTATTGVTSIPSTSLSSDNLGSEFGILAAPAVDTNINEIFVATNTQEVRGADTHYVQRLWGLRLSNGTPVLTPTVIADTISDAASFFTYSGYQYVAGPIVDGSGNNQTPTTYPNTDGWVSAPGGATVPVIAFNSRLEMGRTALSLMGGNVYMGFGSHGDHGPYYGWILGYSETTLALTTAFVTTPTYEGIPGDDPNGTAQGSVWTAGGSFASDGTNLYITTGNGAFQTAASNFNASGFPIDHDYADSLLKLTADPDSGPTNQNGNGWGLKVTDYFTPSNALALDQDDLDFGSGGVLLLPDSLTDAAGNPMLMAGGKESRLYLIDRNNLGKFNTSYPATGEPDPRLYDRVLNEYPTDPIDDGTDGILSTPSFYNGKVYISFAKTAALVFNASTFAAPNSPPGTDSMPTPLQESPVFSYPGSNFTITANANQNGIVWATDVTASDLQAFDAGNLTTPIYDSNTVTTDQFTGATKFMVVTVANGMAYFGTTSGSVIGFGLHNSYLESSASFFSAPTNLSATAVNSADNQLHWTSNSSLATEFRVDRSTNGSTWTTLNYVANSVSSFDDTTAIAGNTYYYRVVAVSGSSITPASNTFSLNPPNKPLTGTLIGTAGSYGNDGNTIAKVVDGSLATFFDAPSASNDWVGLNLGSAFSITAISFAPRSSYPSRMVGGTFQGSNVSNFSSGDVNLYTVAAAPSPGVLTNVTVSSSAAFQYVRYLGAANAFCNIAELDFYGSTVTTVPHLTGTVIGTSGSYSNDGNTIAKAFDGNISTYFDGPKANGNYAGLDLGTPYIITSISYAPRSGFTSRMVGGIFQGSNSATFAAGVINLYTIIAAPAANVLTTVSITNTAAFRYVRYLSPNGSYGDIAEENYFGTPGTVTGVSQLSGSAIGTSGSYGNSGNTISKAFDGSLTTYFDGPTANGNWAGLDLGTSTTIQQISFAPRVGFASRMVGGLFQVSTTANFSSGVTTIYTITATPLAGSLTNVVLSSPATARYIRYLSPNGSYGDIAELEFFG